MKAKILLPLLAAAMSAACAQNPAPRTYQPTSPPPLPGFDPEAGKRCAAIAQTLVGLPQAEAQAKIREAGLPSRIRSIDGDGANRVFTQDYSESRLNLKIDDGKISAANCG